MIRRLAPVLAVTVLAAGCGSGSNALEIGIKQYALDLAFSAKELAVPLAPNLVIQLIPATPELVANPELATEPLPPPPPLPPACPTAPKGQAPEVPVASFAIEPQPVGAYPRHNTGTITVDSGTAPLTLPYPPVTQWVIPSIKQSTATDSLGATSSVYEYDVQRVLSPSFVVTERFRLSPTKIVLLSRSTTNGTSTATFTPSPAIDYYVFGGETTEWRSSGVDSEQGTAMVLQGKIAAREIVDVCGTPIDTFRVEITETMVNLNTGETQGNTAGSPSLLNFAPQYGALVVQERVKSTAVTKEPSTGARVVITYDYTSTLDSIQPKPIAP